MGRMGRQASEGRTTSSGGFAEVADEFEQGAVRVAEVDAGANAAGPETRDRAEFDRDAVGREMGDGRGDRAGPLEAQVAAAGHDGPPGQRFARRPRTVDVELLGAEAVAET